MSELVAVVARAQALRRAGRPFAVATVVRVRGSGYRRPGARLVVAGGDAPIGSISGGCLERDLARRALWLTRSGPALVTYEGWLDDPDGMDEPRGLGCDGAVDVLVERGDSHAGGATAVDLIDALAASAEGERTMRIATLLSGAARVGAHVVVDDLGRVASDLDPSTLPVVLGALLSSPLERGVASFTDAEHGVEALFERLEPPPHLFVIGSGPDAVPLVALAKTLGWRVSVCDRQARFVTRERFLGADRRLVVAPEALAAEIDAVARPLVVVMSHDYGFDRDVLAAALRSSARYIGVLGPRRRTERLFDEIGAPPRDRARVHAPVGLDLGAETPAEVALAIAAEAQAALAGATAACLRSRGGPIHAPVALEEAAARTGDRRQATGDGE